MPLLAPSDAASLTQLSLHKNRIGDAGAAALARAIGDGGLKSLQQLHMAHNDIGDGGALALAQAFTTAKAHPIETLSLQHNNIGDAGLKAIALCLKKGSMRDALFIHLQVLPTCHTTPPRVTLSRPTHTPALNRNTAHAATARRPPRAPPTRPRVRQGNPFTDEGEGTSALTLALKGTKTQAHLGWPPPRTDSFLPGHVSLSKTDATEQYYIG